METLRSITKSYPQCPSLQFTSGSNKVAAKLFLALSFVKNDRVDNEFSEPTDLAGRLGSVQLGTSLDLRPQNFHLL